VTLFRERLLHRLRHLQLSAAEFVGRVGPRQNPSRREELV
jgi:hypothetical protein